VPRVVAVTDVAVEAVGTKFVVVRAAFYVAFAGGVVVAAYDVVIDVAVDASLVAILNLRLLRFCCRGGVAVVRPFVLMCNCAVALRFCFDGFRFSVWLLVHWATGWRTAQAEMA
jgi:hypothetical protein